MKKSKRSKKSNSWKIKQHRDPFFKRSKTLGYRSRASFKLIELNDKFKFIKNNTKDFFNGKLEVIISDMAADTTGNKSLDSIRTNQLCLEILSLSPEVLVSNGVFVSKVFMGEDFDEIIKLAKTLFKEVKFFKPMSSRNESKETYIHCKILKTL